MSGLPVAMVGVSHHAAPVEVRERFVLRPGEVHQSHENLLKLPGIHEAVLLSTCNRTEVYAVGAEEAVASVRSVFAERAGADTEVDRYIHVRRGRGAAEHMFRVAAGLDSMIVGEAQIQGQLRAAYETAQSCSAVGPVLSRMCERALSLGGLVRTQTGLGKRAGSVATAVLEIARKVFGDLAGKRAAVVGAGEMSQLVLETFVAQRMLATVVSSRGEERAQSLAARLGCEVRPFDRLEQVVAGAEVLVSATAAPHAVIRREVIERALGQPRREPLLIFDLALPRDVEPEVAELNVFLYGLDDMRLAVERREAWWQSEVARAEGLTQAAVDEFVAWYRSRSAVPLIRELRDRVDAVRSAELERALLRLGHLSEADRAVIERLAAQLAGKILHGPMVRLKEAAGAEDEQAVALLEAARFLFQLGQSRPEPEWDDESGVA